MVTFCREYLETFAKSKVELITYANSFEGFFSLLPFEKGGILRINAPTGDSVVCDINERSSAHLIHVYSEKSKCGMSVNVVDFVDECCKGTCFQNELKFDKYKFLATMVMSNVLETAGIPDVMAFILEYPDVVDYCGKKYTYKFLDGNSIRGLGFYSESQKDDVIRIPLVNLRWW